jgi:hypothetical protein
MGILVTVCKEAQVELWKENFDVAGNGKVDFGSQ